MKNKVLIISRNKYPNGDAGAIRDVSFAKIYKQLGYSVIMCGFGNTEKDNLEDDIFYNNINIPRGNFFEKMFLSYKYKKNVKDIFNNIWNDKKLSIIHIVDIPSSSMKYLERKAIQNNITLIHDSVEWYSPSEYKFGLLAPAVIFKNYLNKHVINKNYHVISISKYLDDFYSSKSILSQRIPVIMDVKNLSPINNINKKCINIGYAGAPGKKDSLDLIIKGFIHTLVNTNELKLHIIGTTYEQIISSIDFTNEEKVKIKDNVIFYGRISRESVVNILNEMNYTILIRNPNERFAKAGFPTKVVESMSLGVPVICNYSSDLNLYLKDMENAIIVDEYSIDSISKTINRTRAISYDEWKLISYNARTLALKYFDYRNYVSIIDNFIWYK